MFATSSSHIKSFVQNAPSSIARFFSTSSSNNARAYKSVVERQIKKKLDLNVGDLKPKTIRIPKERSKYPDYPYGESRIFKRSNRGLFGGQYISFGNQISEMRNKSRRTWLPNIISKNLWSESLGKLQKLKITTRVLKTINKEGGLDNYLIKDKAARIKELGPLGWRLRYDVLMARKKRDQKPNYTIVTDPTSGEEKKIFYSGIYQGSEIKLTVGRRQLIQRLFPVVKYNTPGDLKFGAFNTRRRSTSFEELLKEFEQYNIDLSDVTLKN